VESFEPLSAHALLLLLVQLALLVGLARLGAELARRVGLPAVVGELLGGIALGPSGFGYFLPELQATIFPRIPSQFHLLEAISALGMIFLLVLTGYETDIRLLKNLGRSAFWASGFGMVVPFVFGLALGLFIPSEYLAQPDRRVIFSLFLATTMAISAMPVIAKILMDLDLTRRNIGLVILSAGVVDDTIGWLILSVIAGAAQAAGFESLRKAITSVILTAGFLAACWFVVYPLLKWSTRVARDLFKTPHTDLVLCIVVSLLCAAATDAIGVHAVFGAFIAGVMLRQVPRMEAATLHPLEQIVGAFLAPIFFGTVGLRVDLWDVGGGTVLWLTLGVATLGKLLGCTVGSLLGGLTIWESLSIAVAMNARGAMGLVAAIVGLSLNILNREMFSIIVVMAVLTSFMAPLLLRITTRFVKMTAEEAQRILEETTRGLFSAERLRVLLPSGGGPNSTAAARLALGLASRSPGSLTALNVRHRQTLRETVTGLFKKPERSRVPFEHRWVEIQAMASKAGVGPVELRTAVAKDVAEAISMEARRDYGLVVLGGSARATPFGDLMADVVGEVPCHVVAVAERGQPGDAYTRILVPVDGSAPSRAAAELAALYAKRTGAGLTILRQEERRPGLPAMVTGEVPTMDEMLRRIAPSLVASQAKIDIVTKDQPGIEPILGELSTGRYDLMVIGVENRALQRRLFFGYETERLVQRCPTSLAILVARASAA
jgi:Kef-type K+ transport system membrane component KefB/nucleotide-binding universal stress UspA family protein